MTELVVSYLSSQHGYHTLGKEENSGRLGRKKEGNRARKRKRPSENWLDKTCPRQHCIGPQSLVPKSLHSPQWLGNGVITMGEITP